MWHSPRLIVACSIMACSVTGCGSGPVAAPVDQSLAEATLVRVLEGWKAGKPPNSFRNEDPPVVVQDLDWLNGATLGEYELTNENRAIDANLYRSVRLTLHQPNGTDVTKDVTYIIGTDPILTVFRQAF